MLLDGLGSSSAFYITPEDAVSAGKASDASATDDRAELLLQLLLSGLDGPAPNVGHMLLGFDVEHGPQGEQACACMLPVLQSLATQNLLQGPLCPHLGSLSLFTIAAMGMPCRRGSICTGPPHGLHMPHSPAEGRTVAFAACSTAGGV